MTYIITIFNINKNSTIKEEIILEVLEYLQNLNESEIDAFENSINNLKNNPKIKNETNNIKNMDTNDKIEENEENNSLYTKLKKLNIKSNKPKKRTYNEILESHNNIKSIEEESEISDSIEKIIKKKMMKNF